MFSTGTSRFNRRLPFRKAAAFVITCLPCHSQVTGFSFQPTLAPTLTISPTSLTFSSRKVLTGSTAPTITVTNSSAQAIPTGNFILSGASPGSFAFWSNCPASLQPRATCSVNVAFTPLLFGNLSATLNIPLNASGAVGTVSLTGVGALSGSFEILSMPTGKVLEAPGASNADGTLIAQNSLNGFEQQQWQFVPASGGYYFIQNVLTGKVLDVVGGYTTGGALIQQWDNLGGANQQWQLLPVDDVHYAIINRNSGKVLDVYGGSLNGGALIQQWDYVGGANQQWQIVPLDGTNYEIVNRNSGYALDDVNASTYAGTRIQQWPYEGGSNQQWRLQPVVYFNIVNMNSGEVLDVVNGSTSDGAPIQQWPSNGYQQQQWQKVLVNGTLANFLLGNISYAIMNNLTSKVLDVSNSSTTDGAQIVQSDYIASPSQQWTITAAGGISGLNVTPYEIINVNSGKVLDMTGGYLYGGALLQQWDYLGGANQQWLFLQVKP